MDAHPTVVLNDALQQAKADLSKAANAMAAALVEQLAGDPHFADFDIVVVGRIRNPETGKDVANVDHKVSFHVYSDRNPEHHDE